MHALYETGMQPKSLSASEPSHSDSERAEESSSGNHVLNNTSSMKNLKDVPGTTGRDWSNEELQKLDEAMVCYPADKYSPAERCMHLAAQMPNRTARDVALRIKWLQQHPKYVLQKGKAGGEKQASSPVQGMSGAGKPAVPTPGGAQGMKITKVGAASVTGAAKPELLSASFAADNCNLDPSDPVNKLLSENYMVLKDLQANMSTCQVAENTELLVRYKDNLTAILEQLSASNVSGHLAQMPQLPVQPNLELANRIFAIAPRLPASGAVPVSGVGVSAENSDTSGRTSRSSTRFLTAGGNPLPDNFLPSRGSLFNTPAPTTSSVQMGFMPDIPEPDNALIGDLDLELGDLALFLSPEVSTDASGGEGKSKNDAKSKAKPRDAEQSSHKSSSMSFK